MFLVVHTIHQATDCITVSIQLLAISILNWLCSLVLQVDSNWVRRWNNMKYYAMLALAALVCAKYCMYMLMVGVLNTDRASHAGISYVRLPNLRIVSISRTIKS